MAGREHDNVWSRSGEVVSDRIAVEVVVTDIIFQD